MIHTPQIEKAIRKVSLLHRKQVRKGGDELPYITHLFSVFIILAKYTKDEDVLIAGLLHDTLEDTPYTGDDLEKDFGPRVRNIVEGVTEKKTRLGKDIDWVERKKGYIEGLKKGPEESLYVSAADKIHNFNTILDQYENNTEGFKRDFEPQDRTRFYGAVVDTLIGRLGKDHALSRHLQEVFNNYKTFLERVYRT